MSSAAGSPAFARVFLAVACGLFVFVCAAQQVPTLHRVWELALAGNAVPRFIDSQAVLGGADGLRANGGRFSWDFLATKKRGFNYPHVWAYLGWLGLGSAQAVGVGLTFAALLLLCQYLLLRPANAPTLAVALLILFSPSCLLAVDRGNNDSVILALVVAATAMLATSDAARRGAGGGLLFVAACLKLYPIAAVAAVPRRWGWRAWTGVGVLLALFALYGFVVREDFANISRLTPRPYHHAYGGLAVTSFVEHRLKPHAAPGTSGPAPSSPEHRAAVVSVVRMVSLAALFLLGGGAFLAGVRSAGWGQEETLSTELARTRFRAGAAIYGGTFFIGNNWDYRLVFLSLAVPLLGGWLRGGAPALRRRAAMVLGLMIVCLYACDAPLATWAFAVSQLATWTLFVVFAFLFGLVLPPDLREPLRRRLRANAC